MSTLLAKIPGFLAYLLIAAVTVWMEYDFLKSPGFHHPKHGYDDLSGLLILLPLAVITIAMIVRRSRQSAAPSPAPARAFSRS